MILSVFHTFLEVFQHFRCFIAIQLFDILEFLGLLNNFRHFIVSSNFSIFSTFYSFKFFRHFRCFLLNFSIFTNLFDYFFLEIFILIGHLFLNHISTIKIIIFVYFGLDYTITKAFIVYLCSILLLKYIYKINAFKMFIAYHIDVYVRVLYTFFILRLRFDVNGI